MEQMKDKGRRLVLGFDAGCMTCSELAKRVEEKVGDQLEIRDLRDPDVTRWIEDALGQDAPWGPTLIELSENRVKAWTGLRMGLALSWRLGIRDTWRVMKALGASEDSDQVPTLAGSGFNRAEFLRGLGGAVFALSVLSGTDIFARIVNAAERVHPLNRKRVVSSRALKGEALRGAVLKAKASKDVKNVWPENFPAQDQIVGAHHTYTNGNTVISVSWVVDDQLLIYYLPTRAIGNYKSQAMRVEMIPQEAFVLKATSVNGRRRPLDSTDASGPASTTRGCRHCRRWKWGCVAIWANGCAACSTSSCVQCAAGSLAKCAICVGCLLIACGYGASQCCKRWR
jgi:hypothetical protein